MRNLVILLSLLIAASCANEPPPTTPTAVPDEEEQGRYLLGNLADGRAAGGWHVSVPNVATLPTVGEVTVSVQNEVLIATDANGVVYSDPAALEQLVFEDQNDVPRLRIIDTAADPARYELEYSANGVDWEAYCDPEVDRFAIPFAGRWSTRRYHTAADAVSFGCLHSGVTTKCVDWGYTAGTGDPTSPEWKVHQACAEMANANYCNNGVPHTRELTPILIRDFMPGGKSDATAPPPLPTLTPTDATWPPPDVFYFEAAWREYGPAICLSRLRWASMPIGGYCPNDLPDPRVVSDDPRAVFCDDLTLTQLQNRHARFINGSLPMDLFLHRWKNSKGDLVTTVAGYVEGTTQIAPFPDYTTYDGSDGILLRNLPGSVLADEVIEVFEQENAKTGDRVTAPRSPTGAGITPDHDVHAREGYVFKTARPGTVAFNLYRYGRDFVSGIAAPTTSYSLVVPIGYVMAP